VWKVPVAIKDRTGAVAARGKKETNKSVFMGVGVEF
jgi:hypothetical protein